MIIELNISNVIVIPELNAAQITITPVFSSGQITPEERAKLAGIEENANNYIHPETHPSSILDVVDVVDGAANKFFNERGEMVAVAHENLTDKNSEAAFQHIDTTITKSTLAEADMVAVKDSATGKMVLTPKSNFESKKLLIDYTHSGNKEVNISSIDFATSILTSPAHGLANNTQLFIANKLSQNVLFPIAALPTGLNTGTLYYVINASENTFQLSTTSGGASIAITDKGTKDYSKWHFETKAVVYISDLPNLKKCILEFNGKSFDINMVANYIYFISSESPVLGGTNPDWFATGGRYTRANNARTLFEVTSKADIYSRSTLEIDFSLKRATIILNSHRMYSLTDTTYGSVNDINGVWVHKTTGNVSFDKIYIGGVFNNFNIKLYEIK